MVVWVLFMLATWYGFVFLTSSLMRFNEINGNYCARVWMFSSSSLKTLWFMSICLIRWGVVSLGVRCMWEGGGGSPRYT